MCSLDTVPTELEYDSHSLKSSMHKQQSTNLSEFSKMMLICIEH